MQLHYHKSICLPFNWLCIERSLTSQIESNLVPHSRPVSRRDPTNYRTAVSSGLQHSEDITPVPYPGVFLSIFVTVCRKMGKKAEFLLNEALISTAFVGGLYTALRVDPQAVIIDALGRILVELAGPETASSYIAMAELMILVGFLVVIAGVIVIGRIIGLIAFGSMWLAGFLLAQGMAAGILLLFIGWGLGALAVLVHTNENVRPPTRGRNSRY